MEELSSPFVLRLATLFFEMETRILFFFETLAKQQIAPSVHARRSLLHPRHHPHLLLRHHPHHLALLHPPHPNLLRFLHHLQPRLLLLLHPPHLTHLPHLPHPLRHHHPHSQPLLHPPHLTLLPHLHHLQLHYPNLRHHLPHHLVLLHPPHPIQDLPGDVFWHIALPISNEAKGEQVIDAAGLSVLLCEKWAEYKI